MYTNKSSVTIIFLTRRVYDTLIVNNGGKELDSLLKKKRYSPENELGAGIAFILPSFLGFVVFFLFPVLFSLEIGRAHV